MDYLKESYQPPVVELMHIAAQSILVQFSVPTEDIIDVEGYEPDDEF